MKSTITLVNPYNQSPLQKTAEGLLQSLKNVFPYKNGAYRIVQDDNYTQNFGYQWNSFVGTQIDKSSNLDLSKQRFFVETGWDKEDLTNQNILEVGSGAGRFSQIVLDHTKANLYSVDYSNAVEANFKNNGPSERLQLFQASIYEMPFAKAQFDKVFCLGVLQHTPDVKKSVQCLLEMAKPGAEVVVEESKKMKSKPVYAAWMGMRTVGAGRRYLEAHKIPWYPFPERAVEVFMKMVNYHDTLELLYETPPDMPLELGFQREKARSIVEQLRKKGRTELSESESMQLLQCYGIPVNIGKLARTEEEAVAHALSIGLPVVMKIESPDIWHKSDVNGVRLGLESEADVRRAYHSLLENVQKKRPDARIMGVLVEKMWNVQHELLIGTVKDAIDYIAKNAKK